MRVIFAETLKKLRAEKGLSQRELAERLYVTRSTVARWENGSRLPDAAMISRLSSCFNTDFSTLLSIAAESDNIPNVIMVDDGKIFLSGALQRLCRMQRSPALPGRQKRLNMQKRTGLRWLFWILKWEKTADLISAVHCLT